MATKRKKNSTKSKKHGTKKLLELKAIVQTYQNEEGGKRGLLTLDFKSSIVPPHILVNMIRRVELSRPVLLVSNISNRSLDTDADTIRNNIKFLKISFPQNTEKNIINWNIDVFNDTEQDRKVTTDDITWSCDGRPWIVDGKPWSSVPCRTIVRIRSKDTLTLSGRVDIQSGDTDIAYQVGVRKPVLPVTPKKYLMWIQLFHRYEVTEFLNALANKVNTEIKRFSELPINSHTRDIALDVSTVDITISQLFQHLSNKENIPDNHVQINDDDPKMPILKMLVSEPHTVKNVFDSITTIMASIGNDIKKSIKDIKHTRSKKDIWPVYMEENRKYMSKRLSNIG